MIQVANILGLLLILSIHVNAQAQEINGRYLYRQKLTDSKITLENGKFEYIIDNDKNDADFYSEGYFSLSYDTLILIHLNKSALRKSRIISKELEDCFDTGETQTVFNFKTVNKDLKALSRMEVLFFNSSCCFQLENIVKNGITNDNGEAQFKLNFDEYETIKIRSSGYKIFTIEKNESFIGKCLNLTVLFEDENLHSPDTYLWIEKLLVKTDSNSKVVMLEAINSSKLFLPVNDF